MGPWADAALQQTINEFLGVGSDADFPDDVRFLVGVAQLLRKRIDRGELQQGQRRPAVFCLHPQPKDITEGRATKYLPMLDNGIEPISGHVWFVNKAANDGLSIEIKAEDSDASIFTLIIDELNAGNVPTVVFETRTPMPEARYYPEGLAHRSNFRLVKIAGEPISLEEIFEVIDRLYEQQLCTPDVQGKAGKLWENPDQHLPITDAEDRIQVVLRSGLTGSFPTCYVRAEQPQASGRLDIEIEESSPGNRSIVTRHAILELKVLRSRRSTGAQVPDGETKRWIHDGVEQAASYRDERGARLAALCCFDMRINPTPDTCFEHVQEVALRLKVECRSWRLFASSKAYRQFYVRRTYPSS
ncbi:hypothetical protein ACIBG4_16265 [Nonomuraea sp. NPDC050383]|uniref:hypothetical protein n=1 Tax=Nonomuraea sp. NPDC050383 TaxID=3364362 RepID=UPI0037B20D1E